MSDFIFGVMVCWEGWVCFTNDFYILSALLFGYGVLFWSTALHVISHLIYSTTSWLATSIFSIIHPSDQIKSSRLHNYEKPRPNPKTKNMNYVHRTIQSITKNQVLVGSNVRMSINQSHPIHLTLTKKKKKQKNERNLHSA